MENKVVLDFSKCDYSDAAPYDEQSLIHRSKMRQIMRMWDQLYDNAIEVGENTDFIVLFLFLPVVGQGKQLSYCLFYIE